MKELTNDMEGKSALDMWSGSMVSSVEYLS